MMTPGLLISFEGSDASGKSTHVLRAAEYLRGRGLDVVTTREPGGCDIAEQIRAVLLNPDNAEMDPRTEALLYAAARAQHVREVTRPALSRGSIVLADRYIDSSLVYQGIGRGLGVDEVLDINRHAVDGLFPRITFFLDIPLEETLRRLAKRAHLDRLEADGERFHRAVHAGYHRISELYPDRIRVIEATGPKDATQAMIRRELDRLLEEEGFFFEQNAPECS